MALMSQTIAYVVPCSLVGWTQTASEEDASTIFRVEE
jgi:hypothetical protein